jgi:succinate dehydrogenase hydrophobic anchor subunit
MKNAHLKTVTLKSKVTSSKANRDKAQDKSKEGNTIEKDVSAGKVQKYEFVAQRIGGIFLLALFLAQVAFVITVSHRPNVYEVPVFLALTGTAAASATYFAFLLLGAATNCLHLQKLNRKGINVSDRTLLTVSALIIAGFGLALAGIAAAGIFGYVLGSSG